MKITFRCASVLLFSLIIFTNCDRKVNSKLSETALIHKLNLALMEAVVQDGFPPPVASRVYAYPNIAAYEVVIHGDSNFVSYTGQLKELNALPQPEASKDYFWDVAMVKAFCDVSKALVYRDHIIEAEEKALLDSLRNEVDAKTFTISLEYGKQLGEAIVNWANADGYLETRNYPKFTVTDTAGSWFPTPPKYLEALEPYWQEVRPFVLDSTSQFREPVPFTFSTDTTSEFYKLVKEVYGIVNNSNEERLEIAKFWDCNPSPSDIKGHVMTIDRQNTPGGHWLGITRHAAKSKNLNLVQTCEILSKVSIAIADGFKAAWDTKYASNNIRPITYIGLYVDPNWNAKLETPNFPEFSSAHSLISGAASTVLADMFGDEFSFTDSTNVPFGMPARKFISFSEAADEAAMSRIYGGIHYIPSCKIGSEQGREVGKWVLKKIKTSK